jgi:hypothetical protein
MANQIHQLKMLIKTVKMENGGLEEAGAAVEDFMEVDFVEGGEVDFTEGLEVDFTEGWEA